LAKRVSELHNLRDRGSQFAGDIESGGKLCLDGDIPRERFRFALGRGYHTGDLEQLNVFGVSSGFIAALVLALYINSSAVVVLYSRPLLLWLLCPMMLYWICRIWILASRGEMKEDPIAFAVHDGQTYLIGAVGLAVLVLATRSF
jgi:hypothetical protein